MRKTALALLLIAAFGGCNDVRTAGLYRRLPAPPNAAAVEAAVSSAAEQIRHCYRSPPVSSRARQIVTRLHLRVTPQGELADLPQIVFQTGVTPETEAYAPTMAQAAIAAVMRCAPLRLPQEVYQGGWDEFDVTFSPRALG